MMITPLHLLITIIAIIIARAIFNYL